ncbi:uncharacterized [Tachysurus ichikawai]
MAGDTIYERLCYTDKLCESSEKAKTTEVDGEGGLHPVNGTSRRAAGERARAHQLATCGLLCGLNAGFCSSSQEDVGG